MATNPSSPQLSASWRKPGQKLRQQVLDHDRAASETSNIQILEDCSIIRYYDVCDKVLEEFLQHSIDNKAEMIESYVLGNRLVRLLSSLLPRHRDYYSPDPETTRARAKSQEQLIKVLRYIDQLAILIDKEEHSTFIGTVIRKSSESSSSHSDGQVSTSTSTLEDHMEMQLKRRNIRIKVSESSTQNIMEEDLGFSMILASESDRSCVSTHDNSYASELKETSWLSNSIVVEEKSGTEDLMPPKPLVRTEHTITTQDPSLEKSMEEEQVLFENSVPSDPERVSPRIKHFGSNRAGVSKLERHFRVSPVVNDGSMKDPSVGYVSSTSSEHQSQANTFDTPKSLLDQVTTNDGSWKDPSIGYVSATSSEHHSQANTFDTPKSLLDQVTAKSPVVERYIENPVTTSLDCSLPSQGQGHSLSLKSSSIASSREDADDAESFLIAQESVVSKESSATSFRDDTVTAAQISMTDSMGFPTSNLNVSQQAFEAIQKAISDTSANEESQSFAELNSTCDVPNRSAHRTEAVESSRKQLSPVKHMESFRLSESSRDSVPRRTTPPSQKSEDRSRAFHRSYDSNGETMRIVGCSFIKTPTKNIARPGPLDISTSTTQSSRSRRIYSCSPAKPEEYEALSLSSSVESIPRDAYGKSRPSLRELRQDLHESFLSATNNANVLSLRNDLDCPPYREESSVSTPTSSTRSLSQSPNWNREVVKKPIPEECDKFFAAFPDAPRSGVDDPFFAGTWSPNDYFSGPDKNVHVDHIDAFDTPSWTAWSEDEQLFHPESAIHQHEAHYSDPKWFELEDHATAKAIEISPSDSFELHQRSLLIDQPSRSLCSAQIGFTKVSKSLSPICETSTTNSISYAKSRESTYAYAPASMLAVTNTTSGQEDQLLFGQNHQGIAPVKLCALDPRILVLPCRNRRSRDFGPVDLDDSINEGFRCGKY